MLNLEGRRIGLALTGSFCTVETILPQVRKLRQSGADIFPIFSKSVQETDTRFASADYWLEKVVEITGRSPWMTIVDVEPIGPQKLLDLLLIAPCTGNTMAKLANGVADAVVLMAAKAHLRNQRPVLIYISTNDGLGINAKNLAALMNTKNIYFVPFGQDNPNEKPNSLISDPETLLPAVMEALQGRQIQPVLVCGKHE